MMARRDVQIFFVPRGSCFHVFDSILRPKVCILGLVNSVLIMFLKVSSVADLSGEAKLNFGAQETLRLRDEPKPEATLVCCTSKRSLTKQ